MRVYFRYRLTTHMMDTPHAGHEDMKRGSPGSMEHCCHGHHRGGMLSAFARGFLALLILLIVISFVASFFGMRGWGTPWQMMGGYGFTRSTDSSVLAPGGMMGRWSADNDSGRVFGIIKKIDGATITILDNGNTERAVVSTASTVIYDAVGEMSIGDLKIGERIGVTGRLDDTTLTAKLIEVVGN